MTGADDSWRHYRSSHFELLSHNSDARSLQLLRNLEMLHAVFFDALHLEQRRPLDVLVYFFGSDREFRVFAPPAMKSNKRLAGYYLPRADHAVIVVPPDGDTAEARRTIFHEYTHHLTFISGESPALWYAEGIAELLSTVTETSKGLVLGTPIPGHVGCLQNEKFLPLNVLFNVRHNSAIYNEGGSRTGIFYAESWALMHYLYFGHSGLPMNGVDSFFHYTLQESETGDPEKRRESFENSFGLNYAVMEQRLRSYVEDGRYSVAQLPLPKRDSVESYAVRPVSLGESEGRLLELDFRL